MESKTIAVVLVVAMLALLVIVSGAGCKEAGTESQAKELDNDLNDLEETSNEINNLNIDELNESDLEELEGLY